MTDTQNELKPCDWQSGMAFRYKGELHKDELSGSIHYFVGLDPTLNANGPIFVRKPNEGTSILHWLGHCHDYERAPEHDKTRALEANPDTQKALEALDRLENDALSSRDGYGSSRKDAELIRAALEAKAVDVEGLKQEIKIALFTDPISGLYEPPSHDDTGWDGGYEEGALSAIDHLAANGYMHKPDHTELLREVSEAYDGVKDQLDCDVEGSPDDESIGWVGEKEIPVTFGQIRRMKATINKINTALGRG